MKKAKLSDFIAMSLACGVSYSMLANDIIRKIAADLREQGQQANTYDKQDQWEAAAKLVEGLE